MSELHIAHEYCQFFETLTPNTSKETYQKFFDANSIFEDPFQKVKGDNAIYKIFEHMYASLESPYFVIKERIIQHNIAYIKWEFFYYKDLKSTRTSFSGVSRVVFNEHGKVSSHTDFWDSGKAVYEQIPLLKSVLKLVKKRVVG